MTTGALDDVSNIPLNNNTALNSEIIQQWMSGANTRGTADILYTCVVTIVLCVWTSIHLNVPGPSEPATRQWLRKMKWTCIGLLAPEIVLFTAWRQYSKAKDLIMYLNEQRTRHIQNQSIKTPVDQAFSLCYGFFAIMGGFMVPHPGNEDSSKLVVLTPGALKAFACDGRFLPLSDRELQDRSNADGLAKLLICAQVIWLLIQCIARKVFHLPLALLEIHTFIHVVCALSIYSIWFRKPLDITEPTILDLTSEDNELLCFLYLISLMKNDKTIFQVLQNGTDVELPQEQSIKSPQCFRFTIECTTSYVSPQDHSASILDAAAASVIMDLEGMKYADLLKPDIFTITGNDKLGIELLVAAPSSADGKQTEPSISWFKVPWSKDELSHARKLAWRAWRRLDDKQVNWDEWNQRMKDRAPNFTALPDNNMRSICTEVAIMVAYGAMHLVAWNSHFPSDVEKWFWRSSGLLIAGGTVMFFLTWYMLLEFVWLKERSFDSYRTYRMMKINIISHIPLVILCCLARCFLVVESFISLRSVPMGVYSMVPWTSLLPHI